MIDFLYKNYCRHCGSDRVQVMAWVNANTSEWICDVNDPLEPEDVWCEDCEAHSEIATFRELWIDFAEVPISNEGTIEKDFLCFESGTDKQEVLDWFEERCPHSVEEDLMPLIH